MKRPTHTPGPWHAPMQNGGAGPTTGIVWADEPHGGPVANVCGTVANPDVAVTANAHLIAAAPDLLAALKDAASRMGDIGCNYGRDDDFTAVCDAIAKAEGRVESTPAAQRTRPDAV